jgi:two-component sensor histidine kinase
LLTCTCESATFGAVLNGALTIHDHGQPGRLRLSGPVVSVGVKAALSLSLLAHELATSAVKYGALSVPDGFVRITWTIESNGADPMLHMCWIEQGGPPVMPPTRRGFGSRLIERGLAGSFSGTVSLSYPLEGVVCELTATLAGIEAGPVGRFHHGYARADWLAHPVLRNLLHRALWLREHNSAQPLQSGNNPNT